MNSSIPPNDSVAEDCFPVGSVDSLVISDVVSFDDHGDLILLVGRNKQPFLVCSQTLARASRVFKAMLYGPFRESRTASQNNSEQWVVDLPEDPAKPVAHVLAVIHSDFARIPNRLSLRTLYSVLVFTDKYDMTASLQPCVKAWKPSDADLEISTSYREIIGISSELGLADVLDRIGRDLIVKTTLDEEGDPVYPFCFEPGQEDMALIPPGFFDNISDARYALLNKAFTHLRQILSELRVSITPSGLYEPETYGCAMGKRTCDAISYGTIMAVMGEEELMVLASPKEDYPEVLSEYRPSFNELSKKIAGMPILNGNFDQKRAHGQLCNPMPTWEFKMTCLLVGQHSVLTREHILRMEDQRKKLGVEWGELKKERKLCHEGDGGDSDDEMVLTWW